MIRALSVAIWKGIFTMDKQNFARVVDESLHNLLWKLLDAFPEIQAGCDSLLGTSTSPTNFAHLTPMVKDSQSLQQLGAGDKLYFPIGSSRI